MSSKKEAPLVPKRRFPEFRDDGDWKERSGDHLFDQVNDRNPVPGLPVLAITQEHGAIPRSLIDYHVSVTERSIESYKVVKPGDFIISLRSFQGGIEFSQFHGICSPAYVVLRRKAEGSDDYFKHYLKTDRFVQTLTKNLEGLRDGKMISYKQFSELELPIPSVSEQHRIADCLTSLDELIAAQVRKVDALKRHREKLAQQLFPRADETQPGLRFPAFREAPDWERGSLGRVFETTSGGTPSRAKASFWDGDIPWVNTSLVNFGVITQAEEFITEDGLNNSSAKLLPKGTVLIAMYGQGKTRGQVALLDIEAATNQACAAVLPKAGIEPYFVFLNLSSRYEELRRLSNSGGQENLTQGLIRDLPLSYPLAANEQKRIVDCLTALNDLINAAVQELGHLRVHKRGLMQQLFPSVEAVA